MKYEQVGDTGFLSCATESFSDSPLSVCLESEVEDYHTRHSLIHLKMTREETDERSPEKMILTSFQMDELCDWWKDKKGGKS